MIIDLTNIEVNDTQYLSTSGTHTVKVTGIKEDFTNNGNPMIKVSMQTKNKELYMEDFVLTDNALWKLKIFTKALKMPNVIDTDLMKDRYVIGHFERETYTKKDGKQGSKVVSKKWEESSLTNTLIEKPQPKVIREPSNQPQPKAETYTIPNTIVNHEIDTDEI